MEDITAVGIPTQNSEIIGIEEFKSYIGKDGVQIVDVRGESEYKAGHVKGADNVFVGTLEMNLDKIEKNKEVVIHCQSGDRSAIAQSLLSKSGIKVKNYSARMKEWNEKGNEVVKE